MVLVGLVVVSFSAARHASAFSYELQAAAKAVGNSGTPTMEDLSRAGAHLRVAREEIDACRWFGDPLARAGAAVADWPVIGPWARRGAALWQFADNATAGTLALVQAGEIALSAGREGPQARGLVEAVPQLSTALGEANKHLTASREARAQLGEPSPPFDQLAEPLARWDALAPQLTAGLPRALMAVRALPAVLGAERPVTFLVVAQTSDDLRATGGFITSVGTLRVDRGRLMEFEFSKVYAAEGVANPRLAMSTGVGLAPPRPLSDYMGLGVLLLRDANWWSDFPTTASQLAELWGQVQGTPVDGVVAFTEAGLEAALRMVGPVEVDGQVVTAENVKAVTLSKVFIGANEADWYEAQTRFSQKLAAAIISSTEQVPPEQLTRAVPVVLEAVQRRDVLVAGFNPSVATVLHDFGLDGSLGGRFDDYIYLVEQNVSYGKLSPFITQALDYSVEIAPDGRAQSSRLVLDTVNEFTPEHRLPGYPDEYHWGLRWDASVRQLVGDVGYYGGYTRILIPPGSRVAGASGFDEGPHVDSETGRARIGGYVGLAPGATRRILVEWTSGYTPGAQGVYRLMVQRQPGSPRREVVVRAFLPEDVTPVLIEPRPSRVEGRALIWQMNLDVDREIQVHLPRAA